METSKQSYYDALHSGLISACQMKVIEYLLEHETATQRQVQLHYNSNVSRTYGTRFKELERAGVIECAGTCKDKATNRMVKVYRLAKAPAIKVGRLKAPDRIELTDDLAMTILSVDAIVKRADQIIRVTKQEELWKELVKASNKRVCRILAVALK